MSSTSPLSPKHLDLGVSHWPNPAEKTSSTGMSSHIVAMVAVPCRNICQRAQLYGEGQSKRRKGEVNSAMRRWHISSSTHRGKHSLGKFPCWRCRLFGSHHLPLSPPRADATSIHRQRVTVPLLLALPDLQYIFRTCARVSFLRGTPPSRCKGVTDV